MKPQRKLTDRNVQVFVDHSGADGNPLPATFHDNQVPGLRIRIGRHKRTWFYFAQYQRKGKRGTRFVRLGFWPRMGIEEARRAALQEAAKVASGRPQPGAHTAITLNDATADYIESLKVRGKKSARFVASLMRIHLLPDFGRFTLAELSDAPALLRDHHLKISRHKPVAANRVMSILSAVYRHAARLDRSLPPASPISAVRMNKEEPKQSAMPFDQFPSWRVQVEALPPIRRAYHLLLLLTGMRGGEAQRLQWSDVNLRTRSITVHATKVEKTYSVPMTSAIMSALKLARPMREGLIFAGARKWSDPLPFKGHDLRHTFINVAHDLGVNEIQVRLLVGHSLSGVHASYLTRLVMEGGGGLRSAQAKISRRIVTLLGQAS
jgi:integrase